MALSKKNVDHSQYLRASTFFERRSRVLMSALLPGNSPNRRNNRGNVFDSEALGPYGSNSVTGPI
jgi:hypothetical protein